MAKKRPVQSRLAGLAIILALLILPVFSSIVFAEQSDAASAIASAKQQLASCFEAARQAEAAGANISSLTSVLNVAGALLSRAELAYSQGDFGSAQDLASQSVQGLGGFVSEAAALRDAAVQRTTFDFYVFFVGSLVGTLVVVLVGFGVWLLVKRRKSVVEVTVVES